MNLTQHASDLRQCLAAVAATSGEEAVSVAERLGPALEWAILLVLLETVTAAAAEITREMAPGAVDVRLRGRQIDFVVTPPPPADSAPIPEDAGAEESGTSRTTLRLPDYVKARMEEAAARHGLSVNAWLVRTVMAALKLRRGTMVEQAWGGTSYSGWVR